MMTSGFGFHVKELVWVMVNPVCYAFGLRSKNGFLDDALTGMANTAAQSFSHPNCWAAKPAENMTRVSTRKSAAVAQADPTAMPTSIVFRAQGMPSGREAQVGNPQ